MTDTDLIAACLIAEFFVICIISLEMSSLKRRLDSLEARFRRRGEALGAAYAARRHIRALHDEKPRP